MRRRSVRSRNKPFTMTGFVEKNLSKSDSRKPKLIQIGLTPLGRQKSEEWDDVGIKTQVLIVLSHDGPMTQNELKRKLEQRGVRSVGNLKDLLRTLRLQGYIRPINPDGGAPLG